MKEEKGKILLQPSFTQQQQQKNNTLKQNSTTNNMTNKHEQQEKDGHQQWPDYQHQPIFSRLQKDNKARNKKKKSNINIFTLHPILIRSKKNQFNQLLKRNQQVS